MACVFGDTDWFHADTTPFSESKMNSAGWPVPGTTKPLVSLNTWPVGAPLGMLTVSGTLLIVVGPPVLE